MSAQHQVHPRPKETWLAARGQSGYPRKPQIILHFHGVGVNKREKSGSEHECVGTYYLWGLKPNGTYNRWISII